MKKSPVLFIVIGLLLCLISAIATQNIARDGGNVEIENLSVISASGYRLAMDVYTPEGITSENKGPAIVVMHGGNNAKEQVNHFCIELSRRGYVVVNADMYGHGESDRLPDSVWLTAGRGFYDAVRYAATIPYVDPERIGMLGYSRGARAAGESIALDNAAEIPLISSIYLVHSDPVYKDADGNYTDVYGARDVAVDADKYDEFFFSEKAEVSGTGYNAEANRFATSSTTPADYIINNSAQSFLYFGEDPTTQTEKRVSDTIYEKEIDGKTATREINVTEETHMDPWYSKLVIQNIVNFFTRTIPTDTAVSTTSQIFQWYFICSLIGLIGLFMFILALILYFVNSVPYFTDLKLGEPVAAHVDTQGKIWFWIIQIVCTGLGIYVIWLMNKLQITIFKDTIFRSSIPFYHGLMCLLCAAYVSVAAVIRYFCYGKKHGFSLKDSGFALECSKVWKSLLLAFICVVAFSLVVFMANYFFKANYLFVYWGFMSFDADRIPNMLVIFPFFLAYYGLMSFSVNCFNFNDVLGKAKWLNGLVLAFLAALPTLFVIEYVYMVFRATNWNPNFGGMASALTWIIALPMIIFVFILLSRFLYLKTGNPFLSGFVTALLGSLVAWTVAEIRIPEAGAAFVLNPKITTMLVIGFGLSIAGFCILRKAAKN